MKPDGTEGSAYYILADPCAGDGEAICGLRARLGFPRFGGAILACEMEAERYKALKERAQDATNNVLHGDAFRLTWDEPLASLLFLNPPYDYDPDWKRLEARFLDRCTGLLVPDGVLLFIVPGRALEACATTLAEHYTDLAAWRFPDSHYEAFGQVVVRGRRTRIHCVPRRETVEKIEQWGREADTLPVLAENGTEPIELPRVSVGGLHYVRLAPIDIQGLAKAAQPLQDSFAQVSVADLIGRKFPTALPPKPTHLALALATGHFNGHEIDPNPGQEGFPPVLLKGMFRRIEVEAERKVGKNGEVERIITVERPRLEISGLRLDTYEFFEPTPASVPSGAGTLEDANTADLIVAYSDALARLMAQQFPALHDPMEGETFIPLPALPRRPYRAQYGGIQAALKLLAQGKRPKFVAEVGTGKTTMALMVCAALSPGHYATTLSGTRRVLGRRTRLPLVRRVLVVCPPHLLDTWAGEAEKVWPRARVVRVEALADLKKDGEIYLLSRESAKLGPQIRGIAGQCPGCGQKLPTGADENAKKRLRCSHQELVPQDTWARLASELALGAFPALDDDEIAYRLVQQHRVLARVKRSRQALQSGLLNILPKIATALAEHATSDGAKDDAEAADTGRRVAGAFVLLASAAGELERVRKWVQKIEKKPELADLRKALLESVDFNPTDELGRLIRRGFRALAEAGTWSDAPRCAEPLYQFVPEPRRWPIASYIGRHRRDRFDMLVLDEAHEYSNLGTAQQKAAHRLVELKIPTMVLTGSIMNGYASSLFANWWALDREFREEFTREEQKAFVERYGFVKRLYTPRKDDEREYGQVTDREAMNRRTAGETPGVLPVFLLRHLLPGGIVLHKRDLEVDLPPMQEAQIVLDPETDEDDALIAAYKKVRDALLARIRADRQTPLAGKLWGQLAELPSYLDRATEDQGTFTVRYPEDVGGALIAEGETFPADWQTPKERWLLAQLQQELAAGRKALVFVRHTGGGGWLPTRLLRLVQRSVTKKVAFLDVAKVPAKKREAWIDRHVLRKGIEVLVVNPNAVRTGLNNLVAFSTAVWYEVDYSASTYRQANGRLHRPGQLQDVAIYFPVYGNTAQQVALELVAKKVTASLQVDGLSIQGALESAGIDAGEREALDATLQIGEAIYRRLVRRTRI